MFYADQGDLFSVARQPSCPRADLGTCPAPCAARCTVPEYREGVDRAIRFLSGEDESLLQALRRRMEEAASHRQFEQAALYRDRAARFQGLRDEIVLFRESLAALSFVYRVPSHPTGEDRGYVIHRGRVVSSFSFAPETDRRLEELLREVLAEPAPDTTSDSGREEGFLVARWFRSRPEELTRTTPFDAFGTGAGVRGIAVRSQDPPVEEDGWRDLEVTDRMAET
jgi:hypothetical protein